MFQQFVVIFDDGGLKVRVISRWDKYEHALTDVNSRNLRALRIGVSGKYRVIELAQ